MRNIIFKKTHKTGSSTVTNILYRIAKKYNLKAFYPPLKKWYRTWTDDNLPHETYNIWANHICADSAKLDRLVPDAFVFTIVRRPEARFCSAWFFF